MSLKLAHYLFYGFFLCSLISFSQVGIGTTNPLAGTSLHIEGSNSGVLINRVSLSGTDDITTIPSLDANLRGLMVYNTNISGTGDPKTNVYPGFYLWEDTEWRPVSDEIKKKTGWVAMVDGDYTLNLRRITNAQSTNIGNFTDIDLDFGNDPSDSVIESFAPTGYGAFDFFDNSIHRITPISVGDTIELRLQFTAVPRVNNSHLIISIDIATTNGIEIFQKTIPLLRGSGQVNRVSESILLYQLGTFFANGAKIRMGYVASGNRVALSNFSLVISRLSTPD